MLYRQTGQYVTTYRADLRWLRARHERVWLVVALALAAAAPLLGSEYLLQAILTPVLIYALAALGLNVLVGYCGQISLGSGAFMAVGAYAAYNVGARLPGADFAVALLVAGLAAAGVGVVFGLPSLRIKGLYLAVATLAAQFFVDWLCARVGWLTNDSASGSVSPAPPRLLGVSVETPQARYWVVLGVVLLMTAVAVNLLRGRFGRSWMATRDMDVAAETIGIGLTHAKLTAFAVSAFYIGVAGALRGYLHLGAWEPSAFNLGLSLRLLFMVIIGGMGSVLGGFLGAAFMTLVPLAVNQLPGLLGLSISTAAVAHAEAMIFGALIVFFLVVEPHGLARLWALAQEKLRKWPLPH